MASTCWWRAGCWVLAGALVAGVLREAPLRAEEGGGQDVAARWQALRDEAVTRLEALAGWCLERKLFSCRADALETLLAFTPDDPDARKALQYKREKGGWTRDPKVKPAKNQAVGAKDYEAKRAELAAWLVAEAGPILDEARGSARRQRGAWVAAVLALAPQSATARGWNDELLDPALPADKARWILAETLAARTRRPALRRTAQESMDALPEPKIGTLERLDQPGGVSWPRVLQSQRVRVLGFPPQDELVRTVRHVEAVWPVFEAALGRKGTDLSETLSYGRGLTIYSFEDTIAAQEWLAAQPGVDERFAEFSKALVGSYLPKRPSHVVKSPRPEIRLEAAPRQIMADLIRHGLGLGKRQAWLAEGLIIHLTWQITGTRHIYSVTDVKERYAEKKPGAPDPVSRMGDPAADWLELARDLMESAEKPDPYLLPGRDFNHITKPDVLYGYGVAAWAVEGLGERAWSFLAALSAETGTDLDAACLEALGYDMRTLEARVRRWLAETLPLTPR